VEPGQLSGAHQPAPSQSGGVAPHRDMAHGADLPEGVHLPPPSVWPFALAAGAGLMLFGIVTTYVFCVVGALLLLATLGAWIKDMLNESD
jgi:hypothetical protein